MRSSKEVGEVVQAPEQISSQGIYECSTESYKKDDESPKRVDSVLAAKGVGCFGEVTLASTPWN